MKEIKFRAWIEDKDRCSGEKNGDNWMEYRLKDISEKYEFPLMQYTGLKDKNGLEIYEGDIVKWDDTDATGYIDYMDETTEYIVDEYKTGDERSKGHSLSSLGEVEVIGNIYENKNLI